MGTQKMEKKVTVDDLMKRTLPENISKEIDQIRAIEAKKRKKASLPSKKKSKERAASW